MSESRDLRQQLRRSTAEAFRRADAAPATAESPAPGDLYHLEACPEPGVEWLVLEVADTAGEFLVVPADTVGWVGSADLALEDEIVLGPLGLRCDLGLWLDRGSVGAERRTGTVGDRDLERARARRRQHFAGGAGTAAEQEVDLDPDYRDWRRTLATARDEIVRVLEAQLDDGSDLSTAPVVPVEVGKGRGEVVGRPIAVPQADDGHFSGAPPPAEEPLASQTDSEGEVRPPESAGAERAYRTVTGGNLVRNLALAASITGVVTASFLVGRTIERGLSGRKEPEIAVPWLLAPLATRGGEPERLPVPDGTQSLALLIDGSQGDLIEIRDPGGELVWSGEIEAPDTPDEDLIIWPASRTPPGDYEVFQKREGEVKLRFTMRIEPQ